MADVDEESLRSHAGETRRRGAEVHAVAADVRDPDAVERVGRAAVERFGKLHVAVNNAGVVNGGYSWEIPLEDWHRVIDIDLWGVIHGIRSFVPRILASGEEGHVVNTASMAAVLALGRLGALHRRQARRARALRRPAGRVRVAGRAGRGQRRHARHDQDGHEPRRHRVRPPPWRPTSSTPSAARRSYVFTDDHSTRRGRGSPPGDPRGAARRHRLSAVRAWRAARQVALVTRTGCRRTATIRPGGIRAGQDAGGADSTAWSSPVALPGRPR